MMENRYSVRIKTQFGAPQAYTEYKLAEARRRVGNDIYNILYQTRLPAVVDIEERSEVTWEGSEFTIEFMVTPVQHTKVTMVHSEPTWKPNTNSLGYHLREIWKLITRSRRA